KNKSNTNNLPGTTVIRSITIAGDYIITGNQIALEDGGILENSASVAFDVFALPVFMDGGDRTIKVTSASATLFFEGSISGTAGLQKTGAGKLFLDAVTSYHGMTQVAA